MKNSKILPLRALDLRTKPHNQRAIAWSCDAELAVAADDSVTIFLPEYPLLDPDHPDEEDENSENGPRDGYKAPETDQDGLGILPAGLRNELDDDKVDDELYLSDSEDDGDHGLGETTTMGLDGTLEGDAGQPDAVVAERHQFDSLTRHLPVSYPSLSPDLNMHVWEAAGKAMPVIHPDTRDGQDRDMDQSGERTPEDDKRDNDGQGTDAQEKQFAEAEEVAAVHGVNHHSGAGTGLICGSGSSLNHVVDIQWSPSGLGRNLRPVLAVLTGGGHLAIYGDGAHLPFGSMTKPSRITGRGKGAVRDLQCWLALWAVGANFVVPGQEEYGYGEFVKAFAWCQEIGAGKSLLAYMNDLRELVVLCVGTSFRKTEDGLDEAVWNVQEVFRTQTAGPHGHLDLSDPDFVPSGSSHCLRWSPWTKSGETWSCLLSYMDRHYVGFKRITINAPNWKSTEAPTITCDSQDWDGRCLHLGADAFLEFENTNWDVSGQKICRGIIATPMRAEPFQVDLARTPSRQSSKATHSTEQCKTTSPLGTSVNPITGLVIHPVSLDTISPPIVPSYTAVRLSATATNPTWWESNVQRRPNGNGEPQWAAAIQERTNIQIPFGMLSRMGNDAEADDPKSYGVFREEENDDDDDDKDDKESDEEDGDDEDEVDSQADFDPWAKDGPDVYPWRMRLWGIALSPGGGSTAILATPQLTQMPEVADWSHHRSRVLFEFTQRQARRKKPQLERAPEPEPEPEPDAMDVDQGNEEAAEESSMMDVEGLTTEARLWEWMYGGGPGVPGLTPLPSNGDTIGTGHRSSSSSSSTVLRRRAQEVRDAEATTRRDKMRELFRPLVESQTCAICADGQTKLVPVPLFANTAATTASGGAAQHNGDGPVAGGSSAVEKRYLDCECENGHRVAVCGATGLAIMEPGISRACGVCGSRCLKIEFLADRVLAPAGRNVDAEFVEREMPVDVCARCGGKWLD